MQNLKTRLNKMIPRCLLLFAVLASLMCIQTTDVKAASPKSQALKAYKKFLSQKTINWGSGKKLPSDKCSFALVYIDNNSVPELFVDGSSAGVQHIDGGYMLYTVKKGKVKKICKIVDMFSYYKKTGVFVTGTLLQGEYIAYRKLKGSSGNIKLRTEEYYTKKYYNGKDKEISKSRFESQLKKLVGKKKKSIPKCRKNTTANRKKYLK